MMQHGLNVVEEVSLARLRVGTAGSADALEQGRSHAGIGKRSLARENSPGRSTPPIAYCATYDTPRVVPFPDVLGGRGLRLQPSASWMG
jgi:hypothetical protein